VVSREWISGELKDNRWHIHYKVPVNEAKAKSASVFVESQWTNGGAYTLSGTPVAQ
jgi:hypothetical protein